MVSPTGGTWLDFVVDLKSQGFTRSQIKLRLLKEGLSEDSVNRLLEAGEASMAPEIKTEKKKQFPWALFLFMALTVFVIFGSVFLVSSPPQRNRTIITPPEPEEKEITFEDSCSEVSFTAQAQHSPELSRYLVTYTWDIASDNAHFSDTTQDAVVTVSGDGMNSTLIQRHKRLLGSKDMLSYSNSFYTNLSSGTLEMEIISPQYEKTCTRTAAYRATS